MQKREKREPGLTKRIVASAAYEGDRSKNEKCIYWDDDPVGLGLRVYPTGKKKWVLQYRNGQGKQRLMVFAAFGVYTLDQARKEAKTKLQGLESKGVDPLREKQLLRIEVEADSVEAIIEGWLADQKPKTEKDIRRSAEMYIYPTFNRTRSWRTITRGEVRAWMKKVGETASNAIANNVHCDLRAAIYWRIWMIDDADGAASIGARDARNPCAGVKQFPRVKRQVRIDPEDWPVIESAIDFETSPARHKKVQAGQGARFHHNHAKTDPYIRAFFKVKIALGPRKDELLRLLWEDVRFGPNPTATFRNCKGKNGEILDRTVPLSDYVVGILKELEPVEGNPYVFVGFNKGSHLVNVNDAWDRIRKRAGYPHVTIHDLRRSFGSWLGDEGYSAKQIGVVLGHRSQITSEVYMALSQAPQKRAVSTVGNIIDLQSRRKRRAKKQTLPGGESDTSPSRSQPVIRRA